MWLNNCYKCFLYIMLGEPEIYHTREALENRENREAENTVENICRHRLTTPPAPRDPDISDFDFVDDTDIV